ncbi:CDP-glucose 4,6-dehydratase [Candidatus Brocadiaceae bacterium]|nr:CDP-glucose 4,6-dehydratase [Candidatus Brocadiaceae bacterium]
MKNLKPLLFGDIYRNKKVMVTGNTGFKGSWLSAWLLKLGADVYGLSNGIPTQPSHFEVANLKDRIKYIEKDICTFEEVEKVFSTIRPDFVFHLAAQSLVRVSYNDPALTIRTNVLGTMNVLEALRQVNHQCCAVMITSDKCYDNVEWIWGYRETDALGGDDPYSASKGAAELVIKTYANSFFNKDESNVKISSVRAGNVIGGGDWAQDRIIPDCMRAWSSGKHVTVRNPGATRPWQHVLEPLSGYLCVGQKLSEDPTLNGEPFNFGPPADQNYTVGELIAQMQKSWHGGVDVIQSNRDEKEATLLKLCCDKALHILGWKANMNFQETVKFTVDWYKTYYEQKEDVFNMTCDQIEDYVKMAAERKLIWVCGND